MGEVASVTTAAWTFAGMAVVVTTVWLAGYRLPLARPRPRQRFRLAVSSATGLPARLVFPVVGTVIYLAGGALAAAALVWWGDVPLLDALRMRPSGEAAAATALVAVGTAAITAFAMAVIYQIRPSADVPGAVAGSGWIREVMVLSPRWRWVVPMASAAVEELFFRGVVLVGMLAHGAPGWAAIAVAGLVFTVGQVVLVDNGLAMVVLGVSSVVLSALCGLLVVVTGSVLPAILVHAAFAGFYTNLGGARTPRTA